MSRCQPTLRYVAWVVLLLGGANLFAEETKPSRNPRSIQEDYFHRSWNRENGLPDNQVSSILQTRDGYLWIATSSGLARFDGIRFVVFNEANTPELGSDFCSALAEDNAGGLWITTEAGFVLRTAHGFKRFPVQCDAAIFRPLAAARLGGAWA